MSLTGVAHAALTVTDLGRSKEWYGRVLGWHPVMEGDGGEGGVAFSVGEIPGGSTLVGLRQYAGPSGETFDPGRVGLDHLAFRAGTEAELGDWERRFDDLGVTHDSTEHTPYGHVLNFKDPDGIALEIFADP